MKGCFMYMSRWHRVLAALTVVGILSVGSVSWASIQTFGFFNITNNGNPDVASQLSVDVWDKAQADANFGITLNAGNILFVFKNAVGIASSITDIYFDDG